MRYRLVIFDMDGTLTEELLDFDAIRREIGLPERAPILEQVAGWPEAERARAYGILDRHEAAAAERCVVHEGAGELLAGMRGRGVATALLTRNSRRCAEAILRRHGLVLDHIATRENLPYKPHPDSILNIVRRFGVMPGQTLMVGDYLYDLQAAAAAGVASALVCLRDGGRRPEFAGLATYCVGSLREIEGLVDGAYFEKDSA